MNRLDTNIIFRQLDFQYYNSDILNSSYLFHKQSPITLDELVKFLNVQNIAGKRRTGSMYQSLDTCSHSTWRICVNQWQLRVINTLLQTFFEVPDGPYSSLRFRWSELINNYILCNRIWSIIKRQYWYKQVTFTSFHIEYVQEFVEYIEQYGVLHCSEAVSHCKLLNWLVLLFVYYLSTKANLSLLLKF